MRTSFYWRWIRNQIVSTEKRTTWSLELVQLLKGILFLFFSLPFPLCTRFPNILAIEGDNCVFDGVIYQSGETFQPSCKYQCTCQDGQIGCVPRCDEDLLLPQPDCPAPRKVEVPGECCEKWICDSNETEALGDLHALPGEKFRVPESDQHTGYMQAGSMCALLELQ